MLGNKGWNEMIQKSIDGRLRRAMDTIVRSVNIMLSAVGSQT